MRLLLVCVLTPVAFALPARAADITYTFAPGLSFTNSSGTVMVSGTITTDGTLGSIGTSDIVALNLEVTQTRSGSASGDVTSVSDIAYWQGVTASAVALTGGEADFSPLNPTAIDTGDFDYEPNAIVLNQEEIVDAFGLGATDQAYQGPLAVVSATPEPGTLGLVMTGVAGAGACWRRRRFC